MTRVDKRIRAALALAELSRCKNKHGAIVMKDGVLLGSGVNTVRCSADEVSDDNWRFVGLHAEAAAILQAGSASSGATIYVARVNKQGEPIDSRPCKRCQGLADRRGVRKIVHT